MSQYPALIIDDDDNNINVLSQLLLIEGVKTIWLNNVTNLGAQLNDLGQVSAVFLDLEFPRSNGYEAFETIKSLSAFHHVPIIAYTVHVSEFETIAQIGFDGLLGKPVNAEDFPEQWNKILHGQKVWHIP